MTQRQMHLGAGPVATGPVEAGPSSPISSPTANLRRPKRFQTMRQASLAKRRRCHCTNWRAQGPVGIAVCPSPICTVDAAPVRCSSNHGSWAHQHAHLTVARSRRPLIRRDRDSASTDAAAVSCSNNGGRPDQVRTSLKQQPSHTPFTETRCRGSSRSVGHATPAMFSFFVRYNTSRRRIWYRTYKAMHPSRDRG